MGRKVATGAEFNTLQFCCPMIRKSYPICLGHLFLPSRSPAGHSTPFSTCLPLQDPCEATQGRQQAETVASNCTAWGHASSLPKSKLLPGLTSC